MQETGPSIPISSTRGILAGNTRRRTATPKKSQDKPKATAQEDERGALRQGSPQEPTAAATQSGLNGELALVRRCPGEHQIGHVHAPDQERERRRPRQHSDERGEAGVVAERSDREADA